MAQGDKGRSRRDPSAPGAMHHRGPFTGIKEATVMLRSTTKMRIADCFVAATAKVLELPLLTRDQGFSKVAKALKVELL